jgi:transposase
MSEVGRGELTDEEWARIQPLLPPQKPKVGRPNKEHRPIINGIFWVLRTGAPWADLPPQYGKWRTVASRFYRWTAAGVWQKVLEALQAQSDAAGQFDWQLHSVDGSVIRAHQHAAGAKGGTLKPKRSGAAGAVFPPNSTCVQREEAGPSPSC